MAFLNTNWEIVGFLFSLFPVMMLVGFFFLEPSDKARKHKAYHISGEWGMRFLWFSLAITPIYDFTGKEELLPFKIIFAILSEIYVMIHSMTYLRYTLSRDGFTLNALIKQIKTRDYLIWGMIASSLGMMFMVTYNAYLPIGGTLFASYHIMTRNWDRLGKGKSPVEGAAVVPYITAILFVYQVYSLMFGK